MATARPKRRVREAKQELYRRLVLEAAERVFAEKGYEHAKMEEIARDSGLSPGTLYTVFQGKADVFRAVHEAGDAELLRRATASARSAGGALEALLAGVRSYAGYFLEHPDFLRMNLQEGVAWGTQESGAGSRARTSAWRRGVEMLATAIRRCIEEGLFHDGDPHLVARMMIAMQQVQLAHWVEGGMRADPAEVLDRIALDVERFFRRAQ